MNVTLLKSKIHQAVITFQNVNYEGSLSIDRDLMDRAGIYPYEKLLIANKTNGERLETYAIEAPRGSKVIGLNGAAARRGVTGDSVTIMTFASFPEKEAETFQPQILILDESSNSVVRQTKAG